MIREAYFFFKDYNVLVSYFYVDRIIEAKLKSLFCNHKVMCFFNVRVTFLILDAGLMNGITILVEKSRSC